MVFTVLKSLGRKLIFYDVKVYAIYIVVSLNTVLLEYSHAHVCAVSTGHTRWGSGVAAAGTASGRLFTSRFPVVCSLSSDVGAGPDSIGSVLQYFTILPVTSSYPLCLKKSVL